jgi:hypothetical protein
MVSIRTMHPYGFRSGQWATLLGERVCRNRRCYVVRFGDGVTDFWPVADKAAMYEFIAGGEPPA